MGLEVGIVGLGLIGASFSKAYKQSSSDNKVYGWNRTKAITDMAIMQGVIDEELSDDNLRRMDIVILCLYPDASIEFMKKHIDSFNKSGLIIDACGTKRVICEECFGLAKEHGLEFLGCHPMAGTKNSGMAYSKADMFVGAPMVICPDRLDDMALIDRVVTLLKPCRFGSFHLSSPEEHDRMIAFTSQMPHLVSNAFIKSPTAKNHKGFSAGSYKDMTRVAWLNADMWAELFLENKDNLLEEIDYLVAELMRFRNAIDEDDREEVTAILQEGKERKEQIDGK